VDGRSGLASGALRPGKTIIDSTSGNTGIALAMIGAALGYPVTLVVPDNVSVERKRIINAFGAQLIFSSGLEGSDGAILRCRKC
jgi:cysteine synthase B